MSAPSASEAAAEPLAGIEPTDAHRFAVGVHAAVFALVDHLRQCEETGGVAAVLRRHPFLGGYLEHVLAYLPPGLAWREGRSWWRTTVAEWEASADNGPMARLTAATATPWQARLQLLLAGLVDEDARFGDVMDTLTGGVARRPTLDVLAAVTADDGGDGIATGRRLVDRGVLEVHDRTSARSEWVARVPSELWDAVRGDPVTSAEVRHVRAPELPCWVDLVVPASTLKAGRHLARGLAEGVDLVVIRGSAGSDRMRLAAAIAREAGFGLLVIDPGMPDARWPMVSALASALHALPVVELDPAPGETVTVSRPDGLGLPVIAVLGAVGGIDRRRFDRSLAIELPVLDAPTRRRRWEAALDGHPVDDIDQLTARSGLQGAHIDRVVRSAITRSVAEGRTTVTAADARHASSDLQRQLLETLATPLEAAGTWDDVVVADYTAHKLGELEARCRHREALGASLGAAYGAGTGYGVRAQFSGSSGTGKTLAARVLAARLGLEVYRVDLSAVVNKYVGETEKNLHRVLTVAEDLDVVLLVDEGDSLLGRRTEVRTANDRFANLETNYLLQRLESYRGIIVVTTNAADNIDPAFQRRLDVVVGFLPPTPRERTEIWHLHLPPDHRVPAALIEELSARCAMTGGQIRNSVLHATLLALGDDLPISQRHVEAAVASEYRKAGATSPYDPSGRRHSGSRSRSIRQVIA